jgi:hypothetical protein
MLRDIVDCTLIVVAFALGRDFASDGILLNDEIIW